MADPQEKTVGNLVGDPPHEKEATPISQKDVVKENGELPAAENLAEIGGKGKEDPTLNNNSAPEVADNPAATENGESLSTPDTNRPSAPSEEVKEAEQKDEEEATSGHPTEKEPANHSSSYMDAIQESFLSLVGLGSKPSGEAAPLSERNSPSDDPLGAESTEIEQAEETPEKAQINEIPETADGGEGIPKAADSEVTHERAGVAEEDTAEPLDTTTQTDGPKTLVVGRGGFLEPVDTTAKIDGDLKTHGGETEGPISSKIGETEAGLVGEEQIPKSEEKTDEPKGVDVAKDGPKPFDTNEANEPSGAEVAGGSIPKAADFTEADALGPQIVGSGTSEPSGGDVLSKPAGVAGDRQQGAAVDGFNTAEEPKAAEVVSKEGDSAAADAGEETAEPEKVEEGVSQEVPTSPPSTPLEQEQPGVEANEPTEPKSFFGVVLKHVDPNGKLFTSNLMGNNNSAPSSNAQGSDNVDKSPEAAHGKEHVDPLPAEPAEQETTIGEAAPSDVSQEKEAAQPTADVESETSTKAATPAVLEEASGDAESPEIATTETPQYVDRGSVDDSAKETGVLASEAEEKGTPPSEVSKVLPGGAPEETGQDTLKGTTGSTEDASTEPGSTIGEEGTEQDRAIPLEEVSKEMPASSAAEDTTDQFTRETSREAKPEEGTSVPVKEDAVEEKPAELDALALEKQPSFSINIPKQGEAAAAEAETPEENGLTTPRGTPLMQRVEDLEQKLAHFEGRQSPRSDFASTGHSTPRSSVDRPFKFPTRYVLEETGSKGTLLDRVAALEQKLAYLNLHPQSPSNSQSTLPIPTVAEDSGTDVLSKPAENQTQEWSPSGADGDKAREQVFSEEPSKPTEDPIKPSTEEKAPKDLPAQTEAVTPSRSSSLNEKKIKAKAAVGKIRGLLTGCFSPKKRTVS